jgi:hypothetical protein
MGWKYKIVSVFAANSISDIVERLSRPLPVSRRRHCAVTPDTRTAAIFRGPQRIGQGVENLHRRRGVSVRRRIQCTAARRLKTLNLRPQRERCTPRGISWPRTAVLEFFWGDSGYGSRESGSGCLPLSPYIYDRVWIQRGPAIDLAHTIYRAPGRHFAGSAGSRPQFRSEHVWRPGATWNITHLRTCYLRLWRRNVWWKPAQ